MRGVSWKLGGRPRGPAEGTLTLSLRQTDYEGEDQGEKERRPPNGGCRNGAKPGKALGDGAEIDRVEGIGGSRPRKVGNDQCSPKGLVRSEDIRRLDHYPRE